MTISADAPAQADALLAEYGLPERAPHEQLRGITRVAAALCGTPTAVVNLLGSCFQHQVGSIGFEGGRSDLSDSMCSRALHDPSLRYTPNARLEPVFRGNPWVDGRVAEVRLYASAPLVLSDGRVIGTLCVFSEDPGVLTDAQRAGLVDLAAQAVTLFELTRLTRQTEETAGKLREVANDLHLSRERYRLLAESSSDVISMIERSGRASWYSPALRQVLGHDPRQELALPPDERVHPDDKPAYRTAVGRAFTHGTTERTTVRTQHASGDWVWLEITVTPVADREGVIHRVHSVSRDVTERVRAQAALAASERRFRDLVERSPEGIVVLVDGRVEFANPAAAAIIGAPTGEELAGLDATALLDPAFAEEHQVRAAQPAAEGSTAPLRQRLRRLDGDWVTVEARGVRVELPDGRPAIQYVVHAVS